MDVRRRWALLALGSLAGCGAPSIPDGALDLAAPGAPSADAAPIDSAAPLDTNSVDVAMAALDGATPDFASSFGDDGALPDADAAVQPDLAPKADGGGAPDPVTAADRADRALEALLLRYWDGSMEYLRADSSGPGPAGYWIFAQAFDAVLDGAERSSGARYSGTIETLFLGQSARGFSRGFFDDETWMALALIRAFDTTKRQKYLDEAAKLVDDVIANGWDQSCCGPSPGGVWWDRQHTQKATASNAGPAIAAVRLAARKGNPSYLAFAQKVYAHWHAHMVDGNTHQVADHIDPKGGIAWWRFTYNEGLMIGAAVDLYGATKDPAYLADAQAIAGFLVAKESTPGPGGAVLFDGNNAKCAGDCAAFKGIGARYLTALDGVSPKQDYDGPLAASAAAIWTTARDPGNTLFGVDWVEAPMPPIPLASDASATMALAAWARRLGAMSPAPPPGVYEAEEGTLHGVGLEATHAGFAGWGYVAGWKGDGQWVDFAVTAPKAGSYVLEFRYAAGAGDASRYVFVNGVGVAQNLKLASTGGWDKYATVTAKATLAAGPNAVSLIYDGARGSSGFLNLDQLRLIP